MERFGALRVVILVLFLSVGFTCVVSCGSFGSYRQPVSLVIVQDGSSSFQNEWGVTTSAVNQMFQYCNSLSIPGDCGGFVVFNAVLPLSWLQQQGAAYFNAYYYTYPQINQGTKYSTTTSGMPRLCDANGVSDSKAQERPLLMTLTNFQTGTGYSLTPTMSTGMQLIGNDTAWGDTETAVGINWAINQLQAGPAGNQKVIIVISDGEPHSVGGQSATNQFITDANNAAATAALDGITIDTVCVVPSSGSDTSFMAGLCGNGGQAISLANANELAASLVNLASTTFAPPTVSGKVTLSNYYANVATMPVTVKIRDSSGNLVETHAVSLDSAGNYAFVLSTSGLSGSYTATAKASHWLAKAMPVTLNPNTGGSVSFTLINGDVNGDNFVEDQDYSLLGGAWYSAVGDSNYSVNADLNGDGFVEDQDYSIMGLAWYASGDPW
jgi:hypothetical protein